MVRLRRKELETEEIRRALLDNQKCRVKALPSIKTRLSPVSNSSSSKTGGNRVTMTEEWNMMLLSECAF